MAGMKIERLMSRPAFSCSPTDSLARAAQILWENDCGSVPVVDAGGHLLGLLTDRDICFALFFKAARLDQVQVTEAMARRLTTALPGDRVAIAVERMCASRVRRLPIVDAESRLVGMLSLADLARNKSTRTAAAKVLAAVSARPERTEAALKEVELAPRPARREAPSAAAPASRAKRGGSARRKG
jgi:CBS domain-containing protein